MPNYIGLQAQMLRTAKFDEPFDRALSLCGLGLSGEAGEVADLIKKYFYHGKPFDRAKLIEEAGDVLWYAAYLYHTLDIYPFDTVIESVSQWPGFVFPELNEAELFTRIGLKLTTKASAVTLSISNELEFGPGGKYVALCISEELNSLVNQVRALALLLDSSLIEMCQVNIAKLNKRYPNGFNTADSLARVDVEVQA